jgi:oligopeptide/dipeptide ABC transporter ATP-binding protein
VTPPLVEIKHVVKHFPLSRSLIDAAVGREPLAIHALDDVSLTVDAGETVGLIGESGSGKTTLGWLIARLHDLTEGEILFDGQDVSELSGRQLREWRRNVQIVFQDPVGSLDPRLKVWQIVSEPIRAQEQLARPSWSARMKQRWASSEDGSGRSPKRSRLSRRQLRARVSEVLPTVGLPPDCLDQYPHEFSGGGRQRLSLARALSVRPKLIVLDEPTSALDVAVQAQILNRLVTLQREFGFAYLLITHNVAAVRYVADRVAVMYLGKIVEVGPVHQLLEHPTHPYTKALLAALPVADVRRRHARYRITGEIPTLVRPPPGCRFTARCPFAIDRCKTEEPLLRPRPGDPTTLVACHRAEEVADIPPETLFAQGPEGEKTPIPAAGSASTAAA